MPRSAARFFGRFMTLCGAAIGAVGCAPVSAEPQERSLPASAPVGGGGPHGTTPMEAQRRKMDDLMIGIPGPSPGADAAVWNAAVPDDNQPTQERIILGRALYTEPRLSADGTVACATCHDAVHGFIDRRPVAEGIGNNLGRRNTPTSMNAAFLSVQFWDGRAGSLEAQALLPIVNPIEMGQPDGEAAVRAIADDPEFQRMFRAAYGREPNYMDMGRALACFERTLMFLDAPFDRFLRGDQDAMSPAAQRGWVLYNGKARCVTCHPINPSSPIGSDERFHNIGVSAQHQNFDALAAKAVALLEGNASSESIDALALDTDASELGRFLVTRSYGDVGAFRTQQVRNVGITAPYMHDGSQVTLWDVMDHYNKGGEPNRFLDGGMEPLALDEDEIADMVEFLFALTDMRFASENEAEMARQTEVARKQRPFRDDDMAFRRHLAFDGRQR
jgi:cytochrome c peroxidase